MKILESSEQLLIDGTFKVSKLDIFLFINIKLIFRVTPSIFYQLCGMHVVYRDAVVPVIFALLPNNTECTYRRLIEKLCELCPLWNPKYLMIDFEKTEMIVFANKFTTNTNSSSMSDCFFLVAKQHSA